MTPSFEASCPMASSLDDVMVEMGKGNFLRMTTMISVFQSRSCPDVCITKLLPRLAVQLPS